MNVKRKPTTALLCLLTALALCAAILGLYPARAAAAGTDNIAYVGAGGGGGGGGGGGPGGKGGDNGLDTEGDGRQNPNYPEPGHPNDNDVPGAGGAGGKGADGGIYLNGAWSGNRIGGGTGGWGGNPGGAGNSGGDGGSVGEINGGTITPHTVTGAYGAIQALGGHAGSAGVSADREGGHGGDGGAVYLALADGLTADSLALQGGTGTYDPTSGATSGGNVHVTAGGALSLADLTATGGANTAANNGTGGPVRFETASPLTVGSLAITGGEGTGSSGSGGNAIVVVLAPLTAGSVLVAAGNGNRASADTALRVDGTATLDALVVGGGGNTSTVYLNGGLTVPAGQTTTLTATANGTLNLQGDVTLGEGSTLNIANSGGNVNMGNATIMVGKGAQLTLPSGVAPKGVVATLSSPDSVDVATQNLTLTLSTGYNSVDGITLGGHPLTPNVDYQVNGTDITIEHGVLYRQAMGPAFIQVTLSGGQQLDCSVDLYDSTPVSFTFVFPDTVGFDISMDRGATWQAMVSGGAVDTSPAAAQGGFFLRQTSGFSMVLDPAQQVISGNLGIVSVEDLAWILPVSNAGGGALHGAGVLQLSFAPMPNTYGALTPDYGGPAAWAGSGTVVMRSTREPEPRLEIKGVVVNDKLLQKDTDWTDATASPYAVRLSEAYLSTLPNGTHTVQLVLADTTTHRTGHAQGTLAVQRPAASQATATSTAATTAPSPKTGDTATALPLALAALSATGLGGALALRRRKSK